MTAEQYAAKLSALTNLFWHVINTGGGCTATVCNVMGRDIMVTAADDAAAPTGGDVTVFFYGDGRENDSWDSVTVESPHGVMVAMVTAWNRFGWQHPRVWH